MVAGFILVGAVADLVFRRVVTRALPAPADESRKTTGGGLDRFSAALVQELPVILGLAVFVTVTYLAYLVFSLTNSPFVRLLLMAFLLGIVLIRGVMIVSRLLFAPASPATRMLPLDDATARTSHLLLCLSSGYIISAMVFVAFTGKLGAQPVTLNFLQLLLATLLLVVTAGYVLSSRQRVKALILADADHDNISWGRRQFGAIWHLPALMYLLCLWLLLFNDLIDPGQRQRGAFLLSFFVVPIWLVADQIIRWLVQYTMSALSIYQPEQDQQGVASDEEMERRLQGRESYNRVLFIARCGLIIALVVWVASLWNLTVPLVSKLSTALFDTLVILTLALMFWRFVSSLIERKIRESYPEEETNKEEDDEWGGAAARGRSYTLLPMIRRFIGSILVTMVTLTILSAIGVDIGPLLAGAGVVGLAVGFGAQKLVADMFSGFFYLLDDAFRVGEYIEAGGITGTVENISLRNVMLRHHRGMLQIVPHSDLGAITNYMRGGIVVKFNLDFPYDANIDQIRKVIKKVGQAMQQDEEYADDFIKPVKSQGVREITNSVMTIRVKFTAKPGAHFLIRREAYKRITEALREKGIHYAHRKVIVDLPQGGDARSQETQNQIAGAAAETSLTTTGQTTPADDSL